MWKEVYLLFMWFSKSSDEVLKALEVNPSTGLSSEEARRRLEKYGYNKLKGKPKNSIVTLLLSQLKDMLIYVLLAAAVITFFINEIADSIIILLVIILNAVIGAVQEYKAGKAVEALQKMTSPKALVRRDGNAVEIN